MRASSLPPALEQRRPWLTGERPLRVLLAEGVPYVRFLGEEGREVRWSPGQREVVWNAPNGSALTILVGGKEASNGRRWRVRGKVRLIPASRGWLVVNEVQLEDYLAGVLANEMPLSFPLAALEAQAVASRSFILRRVDVKGERPFDFRITNTQVYRGVDAEHSKVWKALSRTAGQVLMWHGQLVDATFHASCGGRTASAEEVWKSPSPCLVSVWDGQPSSLESEEAVRAFLKRTEGSFCSPFPYYRWRRDWTWEEWEQQCRRLARTTSQGKEWKRIRGVRVVERGPSGRVLRLEIQTDAGRWNISGRRLRWAFSPPLPSTLFVVETDEQGVHLLGGGYGHGVGLCHYGAGGMAKAGYDYVQILQHYYPGAELWSLDGRLDRRSESVPRLTFAPTAGQTLPSLTPPLAGQEPTMAAVPRGTHPTPTGRRALTPIEGREPSHLHLRRKRREE